LATGTVHLDWVRSELFVAFDRLGRAVVMGRDTEEETDYRGVKASDLLLISLAGCTAHDLVEILEKQRQKVRSVRIYVDGEQDDDPPWRFVKIHIRYKVLGRDLNENFIRRAIELTQEKYCSVYATLKNAVEITSDYEIKSE
jgi:putative redox protein